VGPHDVFSEREAFNLVLKPGFSTAETVTDVSGRGVGLDVVRRNIEALRGTLDIASVCGQGVTISLRLPLTLAIVDGMVVRAGGQRMIIPVSAIVESLRPRQQHLGVVTHRGEVLDVRGHNVPLFRLAAVLGISDQLRDPCQCIVILVEDRNRLAGLLVDEIVGRQQVVIKSLGAIQQASAAYAGCAVLPDGRVGLILDVPGVLGVARSQGSLLSNRQSVSSNR
jgi:two-component system chemotaxis sensor kinase CheA